MDLISVIIPAYNVEKYIRKCLDSILEQSYKNLEIILIDDGSKDCSGYICDEYARLDNRITVIHQENQGVSVARNKGLNIATGSYVAFIDADDYVEKLYLEKLYNAMIENNVEMTCCGFIRSGKKNEVYIEDYLSTNEIDDWYNLVLCNNNIGGYLWGKLFCKKYIELGNIEFYSGLRIGEDMLWLVQYFKLISRACYVPEALYYYRLNEASALQNSIARKEFNTNNFDSLKSAELIKKELEKSNKKINDAVSYRCVRSAMRVMFNMIICSYSDRDHWKRIKGLCKGNMKAYLSNPLAKKLEKTVAVVMRISPAILYFCGMVGVKICGDKLTRYLR